jgi:syntaxin 1B/2/3
MGILLRYRNSQIRYQDSQRDRMRRQYLIVNPDASQAEMEEALDERRNSGPIFAQKLLNGQKFAEAERALKEVEERHQQVIKLAKSIEQLQELFVDMQTMVDSQDHLVLQVSSNVDETLAVTEEASKEVTEAVRQQKRSRKVIHLIT